MTDEVYDLVQIGYGPISQALALMLGRQRRKVAVCERWTTRYPLPRAVCIDHELYRVLSANGLGQVLPEVSHPGPVYQWFNAEWKELLSIDWSAPSISGGPEVNFVHQPTLEEAMHEAVRELENVNLLLGWEAVSVEQDKTLAHVTLRNPETGETKRISARYVVGCDGANSLVRKALGSTQEDRGFEADWLVIDVLLRDGVTIDQLGLPAAGQYCNPERPTTIVPAGVRHGKLYRRWEFMRLPGEDPAELEREERIWQLLAPWVGPQDAELVRHKIYNFRSLLAEGWRDGRLLIAGDAAHVMPPFMGQGMCAGMRDAWNLAWKLALVLDGKAGDELLDSYEAERRPHVSQVIDISIYLGRIICMPDPLAAAERDRAFLEGAAAPPPPFPSLINGILRRNVSGAVLPGAGLLSPHVDVADGTRRVRLDDFTGGGFLVIGASDVLDSIRPEYRSLISRLGVQYLAFDGASGIRDLDGRMVSFMKDRGWSAMIVRPDFYVYGGAAQGEDVNALLGDLMEDLTAAGVRLWRDDARVSTLEPLQGVL